MMRHVPVWEEDMDVMSLYNCGCIVSGDIPAISRCTKHNGHIVASFNHSMERRVCKSDRLDLIQGPLVKTLRRFKPDMFWRIFVSDLNDFYTYNWLTPRGWRNTKNLVIRELYRVLKPGGSVSCVIDPAVVHTVVYQARMVGFKVKVAGTLQRFFAADLMFKDTEDFYAQKIHVRLYKDEILPLPDSGEYILDITCTMLRDAEKIKKGNKLVALTAEPSLCARISRQRGG